MDIYHWGKKLSGYTYYDWSYLKPTDDCINVMLRIIMYVIHVKLKN